MVFRSGAVDGRVEEGLPVWIPYTGVCGRRLVVR